MKRYLSLAVLSALLVASIERNAVWQNDRTLWSDTEAKSPNKARGYNELGLSEVEGRRYGEAFPPFLRSLEIDPYQPVVYANLGLAYEGLHQWDRAIQMYEKAIFMNAGDAVPYYNMGRTYYDALKNTDKALELFLKARDLNPLDADTHHYLSSIYRDKGMPDEAEKEDRLYRGLQ